VPVVLPEPPAGDIFIPHAVQAVSSASTSEAAP
jgi:hypothetical protein